MAESFRNFCASIETSSSNNTVIIIPKAGDNINYVNSRTNSSWTNGRQSNSYAQIHSIYISLICDNFNDNKRIYGTQRYNPKNFAAFDLYINDETNGYITNIVFDGRIVPGAPFFIEKNITLEPTQSLVLKCPNNSYDIDTDPASEDYNQIVKLNNKSGVYLDISASAVLLQNNN